MGAYGELAATMQRAPDFYSSYLNSLLGTWQAGHLAEDRRLALAKEALAQKLQEAQIANSASEVAWRQQQADKDKADTERQAREEERSNLSAATTAVGKAMYMGKSPVPSLAGVLPPSDNLVTLKDEAGNTMAFNPNELGRETKTDVTPDQWDAMFHLPSGTAQTIYNAQVGPYGQTWQERQDALAVAAKAAADKAEEDNRKAQETANYHQGLLAISSARAKQAGKTLKWHGQDKDGNWWNVYSDNSAEILTDANGMPIQGQPPAAEVKAQESMAELNKTLGTFGLAPPAQPGQGGPPAQGPPPGQPGQQGPVVQRMLGGKLRWIQWSADGTRFTVLGHAQP